MWKRPRGSSLNDVTVLRGREGSRICDDSTIPLVIKSVTMGVKNVQNYMTSFRDDL